MQSEESASQVEEVSEKEILASRLQKRFEIGKKAEDQIIAQILEMESSEPEDSAENE